MAQIESSIIIPTKNGGAIFSQAMEMLYAQKYDKPYEVIVIDSGSTDGTLEIVNRYPVVKLVQIKPEDFGHGKTRNLGARLAEGRYLVFITQDAVPATDRWLFNLVRNLERPEVAGSYGRQIPREDTNPMEKNIMPTRIKAPIRKSTKVARTEEMGKSSLGKYIFLISGALISRLGIARLREPGKNVQGSKATYAKMG